MKLFFLLSGFICFSGHTHYPKINDPLALKYANIYADQLIKQFDEELDSGRPTIFDSDVYSKILAARDYIENRGEATQLQKYSILEVLNSIKYEGVVNEINVNSISIYNEQQKIKNRESSDNVIYPSSSKSGNLTGNTFPKKVWSLTFDDGPRLKRTETIVDNLYERGMKASFFMLTREAKKYTSSVNYVLDANMELALHSYNHKNLNKASKEIMDYEIGTALSELEKAGNRKISLFRLPYGSGLRNKVLRDTITQNKLVHVFWNVDTLDWKDKDPESILKRTIKQMKASPKSSGIILFHDIHAQTVIASELVMDFLIDNGDTVCTVGDVVDYINQKPQGCLK